MTNSKWDVPKISDKLGIQSADIYAAGRLGLLKLEKSVAPYSGRAVLHAERDEVLAWVRATPNLKRMAEPLGEFIAGERKMEEEAAARSAAARKFTPKAPDDCDPRPAPPPPVTAEEAKAWETVLNTLIKNDEVFLATLVEMNERLAVVVNTLVHTRGGDQLTERMKILDYLSFMKVRGADGVSNKPEIVNAHREACHQIHNAISKGEHHSSEYRKASKAGAAS